MIDTIYNLPHQDQSNTFESVIFVLQGLLTPLIAVITCYIAWRQWRIELKKYKSDIYDRRVKIYQTIQSHLMKVMNLTNLQMQEIHEFYNSTAEADFLFPIEFRKYIDEIYMKSISLNLANEQYRNATESPASGIDIAAAAEIRNNSIEWFYDKFKATKALFGPYLSLHA